MTEVHERLLECLTDLAMIDTTLETLSLFPEGDSVRTEIQEIIDDAKANFENRLTSICDRVEADPGKHGIDFERFRENSLKMMRDGFSHDKMEQALKMSSPGPGQGDLYYFPCAGLVDRTSACGMPANRFFTLLLREVLHAARMKDNYADRSVFDATVRQGYLAFLFLFYTSDGPMSQTGNWLWKRE